MTTPLLLSIKFVHKHWRKYSRVALTNSMHMYAKCMYKISSCIVPIQFLNVYFTACLLCLSIRNVVDCLCARTARWQHKHTMKSRDFTDMAHSIFHTLPYFCGYFSLIFAHIYTIVIINCLFESVSNHLCLYIEIVVFMLKLFIWLYCIKMTLSRFFFFF